MDIQNNKKILIQKNIFDQENSTNKDIIINHLSCNFLNKNIILQMKKQIIQFQQHLIYKNFLLKKKH